MDRYEILGLLGRGGMGEVYRAYDPRLARAVALKILRIDREAAGATGASAGIGRLLREARAAAALQHPNVLSVFDVGEVQTPTAEHGMAYIAMELVVGASLRTYVGDESVPVARRVGWLREIATALAAAHEAGIVHRDVKPENVMVRSDGVVKVLDFGIARRVVQVDGSSSTSAHSLETLDAPVGRAPSTITREGTVAGTPMYMAPEQLRGENVDARADQFAWGVVAYQLLAGRLPWSATHTIAMISQILSVEPPALPEVAPDVPRPVSDVVTRTLRKDREGRFATMAEVVAAIDAAMAGRPSASAPPPAPPPEVASAPRASGRAPRIGLVAALVVVTGAGAAVWRAMRPPASSEHAAPTPPAAATTTPRCHASSECAAAHGGEAYACRASDGACVPIASEDCVPLFAPGDLARDDTVWMGAAFPSRGQGAEAFGAMNVAGLELARREIASGTASLVEPGASRHVRSVALVTCDDSTDALRAMHHLVDDLGVPAVLGFGSGQKLADLANAFLVPHRVLSVATLSTTALVTHVPQPGDLPRMVWRTTYSRNDVATAIAGFVRDALEPRVPQASRPTRMTLARIDMPAGAGFGEELHRRAVFNGKSAADNGDAYTEILIPPTLPDAPTLEALADRVVASRPTFLVLTGDGAVMAQLVAKVEERWHGGPRPTYLLSDDSTENLQGFIGANEGRRHRVFAVAPPSNEPPMARFVLRYNQAHEDRPVTRYFNPATTYDAVYLLAYAVFALGSQPIDGPSLGRAFARLIPPGEPIEVGPNGLFDGISALAAGRSIDLRGAFSPLDFDLTTGEVRMDFTLVCPDVDARGRASGDHESGLYYRTGQGKVEGALRCP